MREERIDREICNIRLGCSYRTFLFCPFCLASFLSLLIAQLVLGERLDQEGKCLALVFFFRILNTPREFFVGSRRKLINMLRIVQNIHAETAYDGLSQVHWLRSSALFYFWPPFGGTNVLESSRIRPSYEPISCYDYVISSLRKLAAGNLNSNRNIHFWIYLVQNESSIYRGRWSDIIADNGLK